MTRLISLVLMIGIVSGCGASEFDKDMRQGKDSLRSGDYQGAVKHFDNALIEKPTDKDALALMERTTKELLNGKRKEYITLSNELYKKLLSDSNKVNENADNLSGDQAKSILVEIQPVLESIAAGRNQWRDDPVLFKTSQDLFDASIALQEAFIAISEGIKEPLIVKGTSRYDTMRAKLASNDSVIRAQLKMRDFDTAISSYLNEIGASGGKL